MNTKRTQARVSLFVVACFLTMLFILFACLLVFFLPQEPRYQEALVTAEYLSTFPRQTPAYMMIDEGCLYSRHCFTIFLDRFPAMSRSQRYRMTRTLVLTIDGDVQRNYYLDLIEGNLYAEIPPLVDGLHLLEIEIQDKNKRIYRHSWVLEINDGLAAPSTEALPPTPLP